jgi:hypothetical protein
MRRTLLFAVTFTALATSVEAQRVETGRLVAFPVEAAGGILGSVIGAGVGVLILHKSCDSEDVVCDLTRAGAAIGLATVGSAAGAIVAGRAANTNPSTPGAILGSLVGAVAGIGIVHLMTEELSIALGNTAASIAAFSITQGIVTALGSRLFRLGRSGR